ncbi:sugar phosphate isomerase/epimerase family protein [Deinococcus sp. QL22]|uniref:sugar phosphate isomerase/epimerase family protein n=1 Tax=Deinococcus sp. QL22 TaxID=2939437 RepID=UPI002016CCC4|nr:sugar phosphate isomerase/epimerase family protein [Deinococcus sp. QL22]UQN09117.1 sugar phosphate isomerase/epimerase [Deinococcus sp. QL22]
MLFATRLNSLKSRPELAFSPGRIHTRDLLGRAARIQGLNSLSLNFPEHFTPATLRETRDTIEALGLGVDSLNVRYPAETFGDGGFTHPDAATRQAAIDLTCQALDACAALGGNHVIVWPGFDGFDYPFQDSYARMFDHTVEGFAQVAAHAPDMRVGLEYKPWEPRKYSLIGNMGEALLVVQEVGADNLGVVLDYCHAQMANEHAPKAAALALRHNKLFGVHLNDGYGRQDDGLMVGTSSLITTLELLVLLERGGYPGTIYFDTFPVREDPVRECEWNIRVTQRLLTLARELAGDERLGFGHDGFHVTTVLERLLFPEQVHA